MANIDNVDPNDIRLILALAKENLTASNIGNKFGMKASKVVSICQAHGVNVRYKSRSSSDEKLKQMIMSGRRSAAFIERKQRGDEVLMMELIKQGKTATYIADVARVCASRVRKIQADLGLDYRSNLKQFEKKAKQVFMLWCDGMTVQDACNVVGISVASYNRQKLKLKLGKKAH